MKKTLFFVIILLIGNILFPCSPKQIWFPIFLLNLQSPPATPIGENGNNYVYRVTIQGNFQPATKGIQLQCGTEC